MQVDSVHGELLGVLEVVELCLGGRLSPVRLVELGDLLQQLGVLLRGEAELLQVRKVVPVLVRVMVAQLRLRRVRAQQRVRHKRTGQPAQGKGEG